VINPSTGEKIVSVPEATAADVDTAVIAARKAFTTTWGLNTPGNERGRLLLKIAELMERDVDQLASLEALDNGKAFSVAKGFDVSVAARL
jgi:aldehyde dehydrogenase (NAD+)